MPHLLREYRDEFRHAELPAPTCKDEGQVWTAPLAVLAHAQPWPFTYFPGRPVTLLPLELSDWRLRELIETHRVEFVLLDGRDRERRRYMDALDDLEGEGVTETSLGSYRIHDVRALHRRDGHHADTPHSLHKGTSQLSLLPFSDGWYAC